MWCSKVWAGSSAWLERSTDNRKVASSNPARPTTTIHPKNFLTHTQKQAQNSYYFTTLMNWWRDLFD
jgi:hypothetical protein